MRSDVFYRRILLNNHAVVVILLNNPVGIVICFIHSFILAGASGCTSPVMFR
jgi:hypothetical protein